LNPNGIRDGRFASRDDSAVSKLFRFHETIRSIIADGVVI
jgi:hypothetical protein